GLARREAGRRGATLAPARVAVVVRATIDGPHRRGRSPVTRDSISTSRRASRRRTGCSTDARYASTSASVGWVLFSLAAMAPVSRGTTPSCEIGTHLPVRHVRPPISPRPADLASAPPGTPEAPAGRPPRAGGAPPGPARRPRPRRAAPAGARGPRA